MYTVTDIPDEVEGGLRGGDDVKGHGHGEPLPEVAEVQLGPGKLPLHVCIVLRSSEY